MFIIPQRWFSQILRSNSLKLTIQDHVELIIQDQVKKQFLDVFRDFKLQKHLFTLNLTPIPVYHVFIIPLTWFSSTLRSNLLKLIILDHVTYQYQKQQTNKKCPKVVKSCSFSGWPLILSWTATARQTTDQTRQTPYTNHRQKGRSYDRPDYYYYTPTRALARKTGRSDKKVFRLFKSLRQGGMSKKQRRRGRWHLKRKHLHLRELKYFMTIPFGNI